MTEVSQQVLEEAVRVIQQGGVVAFPTETYYGLAVDPFQEKALERIFKLKKRSLDKAILTLVDTREKLFHLTDSVDPVYQPIMEKFWPGPLTLLFPAKQGLSPLLTCNTGFIGIRISSHPVALRICEMLGLPVTATSANLSGKAAAATADEVFQQLGTGVDYIVDGGSTSGGRGSTIVRSDGKSLKLIRPGRVSLDSLYTVI